ncbi:MAG: hypothetical protein ACXWN2_06810 [Candidatus Limnocylindrales bacterium]
MVYSGTIKRTLGSVVALLLLAACSSSASPTVPPAATVAYTGIMVCTGSPAAVHCTVTASDPRAAGTEDLALTTAELTGGAGLAWSTKPYTHASAGGTWSCDNIGTIAPNGMNSYDAVCVGQGGFDKLVLTVHAVAANGTDFYLTGIIGPAS